MSGSRAGLVGDPDIAGDIVLGAGGALGLLARATRRKTLAGLRARSGGAELERSLGLASLVLLGIGSVVGAGIFSILGQATRAAGPAVVLSMVLVGIAALVVAVQYAELASAYPVAGSAYTFCFLAFGEIAAFLVAWGLVLEYTVAAAVVARAWSHYLVQFLAAAGVTYPSFLYALPAGPLTLNPTACAALLLLTVLLLGGLRDSVKFNSVVVVVNLGALLFFVGFSATRFDGKNLEPFAPGGASGVFHGAALLFFSYIGFDGLTLLAEEARRPRDVPRAVVITMVACTTLYTLVSAALVGSVPASKVDGSSPLAAALADTPWAQGVVAASATCSLLCAMFSSLLSQSRLWLTVSKDGLISPVFSRVEAGAGGGGRSPAAAIYLAGLPAAAAALLFPIEQLSGLTSLGACAAFIMVCAVVLNRRYGAASGGRSVAWRVALLLAVSAAASASLYASLHGVVVAVLLAGVALAAAPFFFLTAAKLDEGDGEDEYDKRAPGSRFLTPLMPLSSIVGIASITHIMLGQGAAALGGYFSWLAVGTVFYFTYSVHNSRVR